jgi:predicted PurR-regulated permease PerM
MLGLDMRVARATWTVLVILCLVAVVYVTRQVILLFTLAIFLAYLLTPLVKVANKLSGYRLPRTWALAIVYLVLVGILAALGSMVGSQIAQEATTLATRAPEVAKDPEWWKSLPLPEWLNPVRDRLIAGVRERLETGLQEALPILQQASKQILAALGSIGFLILVPILSFFMLKDAGAIRDAILTILRQDPEDRAVWEGILDDIHLMLTQYIRALVTLSAASFVAFNIFFQLTGAPYGVLLASIIALLEFIPVVGPLTGAAIATIVGLLSGYSHIGLMLIFYPLYRLFQDYVLQPYLLSSGVALSPLLVLFGALAGERIGGIPGMFVAVPVMGTLRIIYYRLTSQRREQLVTS